MSERTGRWLLAERLKRMLRAVEDEMGEAYTNVPITMEKHEGCRGLCPTIDIDDLKHVERMFAPRIERLHRLLRGAAS